MGELDNNLSGQKVWITLVIFLSFLCYSNIYKNEFVFDDLSLISENGSIRDFPNLSRIFLTSSWTAKKDSDRFIGYRPVTTLSFALNYALHGMSPGGYRLVDVLIHMGNSLLVYGLCFTLFRRYLPAGIIALLFATHPMHSEAVAGAFARADELAALFVLLALWSYIKAWGSSVGNRSVLLLISMACLLAGLASKESAACFFLILIPYEVCFNYFPLNKLRNADKSVIGAKIFVFCLFLLTTLAYLFWWRPSVTGQFGDLAMAEGFRPPGLLHNWPFIWRLTAFKAFAVYMKILFWPVTLSGDYLYNQIPLTNQITDPLVLTGMVLFTGFFCLGIWALVKGWGGVAFGIFFTYAAYAPLSNLLIPIGALVGERLFYLPSLGFCIVLGLIFDYLYEILKRRFTVKRASATVVCLVGLITLAYGSRTFIRNFDWKNPYVFFKKTSITSPNSAVSHFSTAVAYLMMLEDTGYIERWMSADQIKELKSRKNGGRSLLIKRGLESVETALRITSARPDTRYLNVYGALLAMAGSLDKAREVLMDVIQRDPGLLEAKITLGAVDMRLASRAGKKGASSLDRARDYLTESVRYLKEVERRKAVYEETPVRLAQVYFNLSIAQEGLGNYDEALRDINNAFLWLNKAMTETGEGQFLFGRFHLIKATILTGKGDYDRAIEELSKAKETGSPQFRRYVLRMRKLKPLHGHRGFKELIKQE